ncbi:MAG: MmcB family DNA repair protein, partial [Methylocystis sp.]|nr:MmcB family DNA repair protein [Methylocystis sp.]
MTAILVEGATALESRADVTKCVARGARRYLRACGFSVVCEAPLPNGRRADLIALASDGV